MIKSDISVIYVAFAAIFYLELRPNESNDLTLFVDVVGGASLEFRFRTDYHLCTLRICGPVAWRSLGDEIPIKNQSIKSRCIECPDRIEG